MLDFRLAKFRLAAHEQHQWPPDQGAEVAFAGRSNVGKSSAINVITQRQGLARTSKTPGRTQQIVFFDLDTRRRLVDLPGYGYAKVPDSVRLHWRRTISDFLIERQSLRGLMLPMDARRPLMPLDVTMLEWCAQAELPTHILLTKADKLSRSAANIALQKLHRQINTDLVTVQLFSATKKTGVNDARYVLNAWLTQ